jgi:segregation and condensation protein B
MHHPLSRPYVHHLSPRTQPPRHRLPLLFRLLSADTEESGERSPLARDPRLALLEAALLVADEPLTARKLAALAGLADAAEARRLVNQLHALYDQDGSAFQVEELAGGYQLLTRAEFHPWLALLRRQAADAQLSAVARETLAIVAYRGPVTRADVEAIRGVGSSEVLRQLMEKGLVRLAGRDDSLGRPALYETTKKFLAMFGLKSLKDLPPAEGLAPPRQQRKKEGEGEMQG